MHWNFQYHIKFSKPALDRDHVFDRTRMLFTAFNWRQVNESAHLNSV